MKNKYNIGNPKKKYCGYCGSKNAVEPVKEGDYLSFDTETGKGYAYYKDEEKGERILTFFPK